jgi:S1-C subfamily serine protease
VFVDSPTSVERTDAENDLALLKMQRKPSQLFGGVKVWPQQPGNDPMPAPLAPDSSPSGTRVAICGYPFSTLVISATPGVTTSIPAGNTERYVVCADADLGHSGGPVFDEAAQVIGACVSGTPKPEAGSNGQLPELPNLAIVVPATAIVALLDHAGIGGNYTARL